MPTYQYRCNSCGNEFEEFQSIVEDPIKVCPKCGGEVHRLITGGAGFIFKGSGFYITDYKKKEASYRESSSRDHASSHGSSSGSSDSGSKSESKSTDKSGTKPEAKSESRSESKSESKSETKSESKSGSKSDSKSKSNSAA